MFIGQDRSILFANMNQTSIRGRLLNTLLQLRLQQESGSMG